MRPDWDAYLRKHLPDAELFEIGDALKRDPSLQRDLDGFIRFQDQVKQALASEAVPQAKLRAKLGDIRKENVSEGKTGWSGKRLALGALAATLIFGAFFVRNSFEHDPFNIARSPEVAEYSGTREADGWNWIRQEPAYSNLPKLAIANGKLKYKVSRLGEDWACMDYILDGDPVRLYIAPSTKHSSGSSRIVSNQGVAWTKNGYSFALKGNAGARLAEFADHLIQG